MFGLLSLCNARKRETISEGLTLAVKHYFEDYSDADEVDGSFYRALDAIVEYADVEIEDVIVARQILVEEFQPRRELNQLARRRVEDAQGAKEYEEEEDAARGHG
jgi:hypothetical protein